jgi:hypothetical protein
LPVLVLVHPAWLGAGAGQKLIPLLVERGHSVHIPTLTGLGECSYLAQPGIVMQTHIDDVISVLPYDDLRGVILAGTSSSWGGDQPGCRSRVRAYLPTGLRGCLRPEGGQAGFDLISPQRRPAMEALIEPEGFGWLRPRL